MRKLFLSIIAVSCFSAVAQNRVKQLDSIFNAEAAAGNFNGNVLIAEKGNVIYKVIIYYFTLVNKLFKTLNNNHLKFTNLALASANDI